MGQSENPVLESLEDRRKSCPSRFFLCYGVKHTHTHTHGSHIIVPCPRGNRGARKKERCSPNEVKECPENSLHHPHTHSHEYTHNPSRSPSPLEIMPPLSYPLTSSRLPLLIAQSPDSAESAPPFPRSSFSASSSSVPNSN